MVNELNALESKIVQVASLCRTLRAENTQLRQQLAAAEAERNGLAERMETARNRIEQLVRQLPETKTPA
ncbi:hypothetical protein [Propionivibrio sp.]|jgi:cell division protein ZapB|uniref:hypothetical protein n=1 Tax=Propionivibrio sp. TaxID=2212460 RepID=UPI0039E45954